MNRARACFSLRSLHPVRICQRGYTLIELVMTIVLLSLLGAVGVTMISDSFDITLWTNANQASAAKSRYALERLERELREVKKLAGGGYCVGTLTNPASSLTFQQPAVGSTNTSACATQSVALTINHAGGQLTLQKAGATATLLDGVTAFSLNFLDQNLANTTSAASLRYVVINLTVNDASGQAITQRARVALRNAP